MGQYIYESHMGGLYCTEYSQDFEDLYCEQCGDSDWELGYANNLEEAWKLLESNTATFDETVCDTCPHNDDYEYCDEHCEEYQHSGGYSLPFVMEFLVENFECKNLHYIYLISRHTDGKDWVLVDCDPRGFKFGERHALPKMVCPFEKYVPMMARSLTGFLDGPCKDLKEVAVRKTHNGFIHIYECIEEMDEEYPKENWKDAASYKDNSWYGYMLKDKVKLIDEQEELIKYL